MKQYSRTTAATPSNGEKPPGEYHDWKCAMLVGNEAFSVGKHRIADMYFLEAIDCAERLFALCLTGGLCATAALEALIGARHNAAENLLRLGLIEEAHDHLLSVFQAVCDAIRSPATPETLRRASVVRLPFVLEALVSHLARSGADPDRISAVYGSAANAMSFNSACGLH